MAKQVFQLPANRLTFRTRSGGRNSFRWVFPSGSQPFFLQDFHTNPPPAIASVVVTQNRIFQVNTGTRTPSWTNKVRNSFFLTLEFPGFSHTFELSSSITSPTSTAVFATNSAEARRAYDILRAMGGSSVRVAGTLTVSDELEAPTFDSSTGDPLSANVGIPVGYQVPLADGLPGPTYAATGLPAGLSFDAGTRTITGTPTGTASGNIVVTATNSQGSDTFTIPYNVEAIPNNWQVINVPASTFSRRGSVAGSNLIVTWNYPNNRPEFNQRFTQNSQRRYLDSFQIDATSIKRITMHVETSASGGQSFQNDLAQSWERHGEVRAIAVRDGTVQGDQTFTAPFNSQGSTTHDLDPNEPYIWTSDANAIDDFVAGITGVFRDTSLVLIFIDNYEPVAPAWDNATGDPVVGFQNQSLREYTVPLPDRGAAPNQQTIVLGRADTSTTSLLAWDIDNARDAIIPGLTSNRDASGVEYTGTAYLASFSVTSSGNSTELFLSKQPGQDTISSSTNGTPRLTNAWENALPAIIIHMGSNDWSMAGPGSFDSTVLRDDPYRGWNEDLKPVGGTEGPFTNFRNAYEGLSSLQKDNFAITLVDGTYVSYDVVGSLPAGLSFNRATRMITGIPTVKGQGNIVIRATSQDGRADYTIPYDFIGINDPPRQVTGLTVIPKDSALDVRSNRVAGATSYIFEYREEGTSSWTPLDPVEDPQLRIQNLVNDVTYDIRVKGRNNNGDGPYSDIVTGTPEEFFGIIVDGTRISETAIALTGSKLGQIDFSRSSADGNTLNPGELRPFFDMNYSVAPREAIILRRRLRSYQRGQVLSWQLSKDIEIRGFLRNARYTMRNNYFFLRLEIIASNGQS